MLALVIPLLHVVKVHSNSEFLGNVLCILSFLSFLFLITLMGCSGSYYGFSLTHAGVITPVAELISVGKGLGKEAAWAITEIVNPAFGP